MKRFFGLILTAWLIIWAINFNRELFWQGKFKWYQALIGLSLEEKIALRTGKDFHQFLKFSKLIIPLNSRYQLIIEEDKQDRLRTFFNIARARYYLYPRIKVKEAKEADYIIVYKTNYQDENFVIDKEISSDSYILKRK